MIITCPNCTTRYNIQPSLLGNGRSTRCFNCGHSWFQEPVVSPPPPPMPPAAAQPAMMPGMAPHMAPQMAPQMMPGMVPQAFAQPGMAQTMPGQPIPGQPMPGQPIPGQPMPGQPMAYQEPAAPAAPPPMPEPGPEPEPEPEPMPEPEPEPEPEIEEPDFDAALDGEEDEPGLESTAEEDAEGADDDDLMAGVDLGGDDDDEQGLSQEDLDAMFGDDDDDAAPMESLVTGTDEADDDLGADIDPEDIPEPEPIPHVFTPEDTDDDAPPRSLVKTIGIGAGVFVVLLFATLFFARGLVMDMLPFTKGIYESVGLGEKVGAGLKIGEAKPRRGTSQGKEALIVTGVITNVTEETRAVPMIKVSLHDGENNEVQSTMAAPLKNQLVAGEKIKFRVTLVEPSPLARRVEVVFAAPEEAADGGN